MNFCTWEEIEGWSWYEVVIWGYRNDVSFSVGGGCGSYLESHKGGENANLHTWTLNLYVHFATLVMWTSQKLSNQKHESSKSRWDEESNLKGSVALSSKKLSIMGKWIGIYTDYPN